MRLTFKSTYLSIKDFPEIDLPRFTLVTGSNGSGKSHLLRAIQAGNIRTDVAADPKTEVRSFDWANMIPQDSGIFDGQNWVPQRTAVFQRFQEYLRQFGGEILDAGRSFGLPRSHLLDAGQLATMELSELQSVLADPEKSAAAFKAIQEATTSVGQKIRSHLGNQDQLQELDKVRVSANRPIVSLVTCH
jgi:energy-coupling factor transporter ATP-binding protein EcfA2